MISIWASFLIKWSKIPWNNQSLPFNFLSRIFTAGADSGGTGALSVDWEARATLFNAFKSPPYAGSVPFFDSVPTLAKLLRQHVLAPVFWWHLPIIQWIHSRQFLYVFHDVCNDVCQNLFCGVIEYAVRKRECIPMSAVGWLGTQTVVWLRQTFFHETLKISMWSLESSDWASNKTDDCLYNGIPGRC